MQICRMDYNDLSGDKQKATLHVYGIGNFDVFSGKPGYINKPECSFIDHASLPPGQYWIVDRPAGGFVNRKRSQFLDLIHNTDHSGWLGCKYPSNPHHSLLEIFRHTDYVP